jgi:hypothetical protein
MTFKEWLEEYKPYKVLYTSKLTAQENHNINTVYNSLIWTLVDVGNGIDLIAGKKYVDYIGFVFCNNASDLEENLIIQLNEEQENAIKRISSSLH